MDKQKLRWHEVSIRIWDMDTKQYVCGSMLKIRIRYGWNIVINIESHISIHIYADLIFSENWIEIIILTMKVSNFLKYQTLCFDPPPPPLSQFFVFFKMTFFVYMLYPKKTFFIYGYASDRNPVISLCSHLKYVSVIRYGLTGVLKYSCFLVEEFPY